MTIRLAVVDDSAFVRKAVARMMEGEADVKVVGLASNGEELLAHVDEWDPNAITLDLSMPGLGGLATLERILQWREVPVLILSGHSTRDAPLAVEALHRGAVDFVDKQEFSLVDFQGLRNAILARLRAFERAGVPPAAVEHPARRPEPRSDPQSVDLVVIGASTGGPPAIEEILVTLESPPNAPIVIVQHMPAGFTTAFAARLNHHLPFPVKELIHNEALVAGSVYIAPAGSHVRIRQNGSQLFAALFRFPEMPHRPSIDVLFASAAELDVSVMGVLLTGMGDDGASGLVQLHAGGAWTIAQDESSSIVYGMPRAAMELGGVSEQLSLRDIASRLRNVLAYPPP